VHGGIFKSNFAVGKRRENSSAAFDKVAVGNALFPELTPFARYKEAGRQRNLRFWVHSSFAFATSETSVSGHATELQASLVKYYMQQPLL